jgi:hypothetical protein
VICTTGRLARRARACIALPRYRWQYEAMVAHLGPGWGEDDPIGLDVVLDVLGPAEALWALRCVRPEDEAERDQIARLFACDCAERALPIYERDYPGDLRPRAAIAVARRFAAGEATPGELAAARAAAREVAWEVSAKAIVALELVDARDAAWAAAWAAAKIAWVAAWVADKDADKAAEMAWQATRLRELLDSVSVTVPT